MYFRYPALWRMSSTYFGFFSARRVISIFLFLRGNFWFCNKLWINVMSSTIFLSSWDNILLACWCWCVWLWAWCGVYAFVLVVAVYLSDITDTLTHRGVKPVSVLCVVVPFPSTGFVNPASDTVLSLSKARIILSSCESSVCPRFKLLNSSVTFPHPIFLYV